MEKEQKIVLSRIIISGILLLISLFNIGTIAKMVLCLVGYAIIGYDIIWKALKNIFHGEIFDECFLMLIATAGALALAEFSEAVAVMLFYQLGEFLQDLAVDKSRESISKLMDIRPDYANIEKDGKIEKISPEELKIGDIFIVNPGEKIPVDGVVVEGESSLNTSALTGESLPLDVSVGDKIVSGCINANKTIKVKALKLFSESTSSKILEMMENSDTTKAKSEKFISKFAKWYTPIVVALAVLVAIIPSIITGAWSEWIRRALIFLVISCPCALVVSIPLSFFAGIGGLSKNGVLVKGANHIETLSKIQAISFDKTGTLTKGSFFVTVIHPNKISADKLLEICALAEHGSSHPIAQSILAHYNKPINIKKIKDSENLAGYGVKATIDKKEVYVCNEKLLKELQIEYTPCEHVGTVVHVVINKEYAGHIVIADEIKETSKDAISQLKDLKISHISMLTGDKKDVAENLANQISLDNAYSNLLPEDKVNKLREIKSKYSPVAFVGDGINDAPVLKVADVGIAMGGLGSDAAIDTADVVLMDDNPQKIATAIKSSRKTIRLVKENIVFTLSIKILMMVLGSLGIISMWGAVFADVGVSLIAILNSLRGLRIKKDRH